jgi:hypothetical protein
MDSNYIKKYWINSKYKISKSYFIKENFKKKFISKNLLIPNYKKYYYIINNDYYYLFEYVFNDNHIMNEYILENIFDNYCSNIKYNEHLKKKISLYDFDESFSYKFYRQGCLFDDDILSSNKSDYVVDFLINKPHLIDKCIFLNNKNKNAIKYSIEYIIPYYEYHSDDIYNEDMDYGNYFLLNNNNKAVDYIIKNKFIALYKNDYLSFNNNNKIVNMLMNNINSIYMNISYFITNNNNNVINFIEKNINKINLNNLLFNTNPKVIDIIIENNNRINDINLYYIDNHKLVNFIINDFKIINWKEFIKNRINYIKSLYFYNLFHIHNQVNMENYDTIIKNKLVNRRPKNYYYDNHDDEIDYIFDDIFKINYVDIEGYQYDDMELRYYNNFSYYFFVDNLKLFFKYSSKKLLLYIILKKFYENHKFFIDNPKIYNRLKYYRLDSNHFNQSLSSIYRFKNNKLKYFIKNKYL